MRNRPAGRSPGRGGSGLTSSQREKTMEYSKTMAGMVMRGTALRFLELPMARRFVMFCLGQHALGGMDSYSLPVCRAYEAERLDLRMRWNAGGRLLEHESM